MLVVKVDAVVEVVVSVSEIVAVAVNSVMVEVSVETLLSLLVSSRHGLSALEERLTLSQ